MHEEIFIVNSETNTILNYITFVDYDLTSLINMLDGPRTRTNLDMVDSAEAEGFRSQEIFTQEKYIYLYYKGLCLLEFLYDNGMTHGHINANSLRISDDYTFTLSDFPISIVMPGYTRMTTEQQADVKVEVRGFNKTTVSDNLIAKLTNLIQSYREEEKKQDVRTEHEFQVVDLI